MGQPPRRTRNPVTCCGSSASGAAAAPLPAGLRVRLDRGDLALVPELQARGLLAAEGLHVATLEGGWTLPPPVLADALRAVRGLEGADWKSDRPSGALGRAVLEEVLAGG